MRFVRRHIPAALAAAFALYATPLPAGAVDEVNVTKGLTAESVPLALHGYDAVAYFTRGAPTPGSAEHVAVHGGAAYYFANEENRAAFEEEPARYTPAYGGFCAYGVSVGKKFDGDPAYWKIDRGRLYLNLNAEIAEKFEEDVPGAVTRADRRWRDIEHEAVEGL